MRWPVLIAPRRRALVYAVGLAAAWVMLWDRITLSNIIVGLAVASVLLAAFPLRPITHEADHARVAPIAAVQLVASVLRQLVVSNLVVARVIISRRPTLATGVVACPMRVDSSRILSIVAFILALSPGLMAVEATDHPPMLYVHVLRLSDPNETRLQVARLERQVIDAFGSARDRRRLITHASRTVPGGDG